MGLIKWSGVRSMIGNHYYISDCFKYKIIIHFTKDQGRYYSLEIDEKNTIEPFDFLHTAKDSAQIIKDRNE